MRRVFKRAVTAPRVAERQAVARQASKAGQKPASNSITLDPDFTTTEAFRAVTTTLIARIAAQQAAVKQGDPVGVHQMQIALRRTRAAITIFAASVHGPETERLKLELKWLTGRLGPARDLHLMDLKLQEAGGVGSATFRKRVAADRANAFATATRAVTDKRFDKLLADLQRWVDATDTAQTAQDVPEKARAFAKRTLKRRAKRLIGKLERLAELDDEQRHRVRIAAKKLYYAAGFFESLFAGRSSGRRLVKFSKRLKKLLDALGVLNDAAVQRELATNVASKSQRKTAGAAKAAEDVAAASEAARDDQMHAAMKAARRLAETRLFGA